MTQDVENTENVELTEDQVKTMIIAYGINHCINSYDKDIRNIVTMFVNLDIKEFVDLWDHINDAVKLKIITAHNTEFKEWLNSLSDKQ